MLSDGLPRNAGGTCDLIVEGAVVNCVATALVELSNINTLAAVALKSTDAVILLQDTT